MNIFATLRSRDGVTVVFAALTLVGLLGVASLAIDIGHLLYVRTRLQATADAAALAAAQEVPNEINARTIAQQYATMNESGDASVLANDDVELGHWDAGTGFVPEQDPLNAVHVIVRRSAVNANSVGTWFARVIGIDEADVEAEAVAARSASDGGSRFMIDQEMIDTDEPAIEALAEKYDKTPEEIISDNDGDWFIDIPAGEVLELPTGQVGDPALFDFNHPVFPFTITSDPSFEDFLNYNEDSSSWRYDLIDKEMLDPLYGVFPVEDPALYPSFVNPNCQVSPVYKSDISANDPVDGYPPINALGWRRGLLAFKILGVGSDPDGIGSKLPNLIIEVCPPTTDLGEIEPGPGGESIRLVG